MENLNLKTGNIFKKNNFNNNTGWLLQPNKKIYGSPVITNTYTGLFDRSKVKKYVNEFASGLRKKGKKAMISVAVHYSRVKWLGGRLYDLDDEINIADPSDSDVPDAGNITKFIIYLVNQDKFDGKK